MDTHDSFDHKALCEVGSNLIQRAQVFVLVRFSIFGPFRQTSQKTLVALAAQEPFHKAVAAHLPALAWRLTDRRWTVRQAAHEMLTVLARHEHFHDALAAADLIPASVSNFLSENERVRKAAFETLLTLGKFQRFHPALAAHVPVFVQSLIDAREDVRQHVQQTLIFLAEQGPFHNALAAQVPVLVRFLQFENRDLRGGHAFQAAKEILLTLAKHEFFLPVLAVQVSELVRLRADRREDVRKAGHEILIVLTCQNSFRKCLTEYGWTLADLGIFDDIWWLPFPQPAPYGKLSIGAKAVLRWTFLSEVERTLHDETLENTLATRPTTDTDWTRTLSSAVFPRVAPWATNLARLEALDRALGLPSVGAELHLPLKADEEFQLLSRVANALASGVGPHKLIAAHRERQDQLDLRLLPAYPSTFPKLLRFLLETSPLAKIKTVGAHYSVGVDLGEALVPLALALFYGDETYAGIPRPRGRADVGFPGIYTYRGATLGLGTGQVTKAVQSNLHLRPLRVLAAECLSPGQFVHIPKELFPRDLEILSWLASAASAAPSNTFRSFLEGWNRWLESLPENDLPQHIQKAQRSISTRSSQGVNDALDAASRAIFQSLYGLSPESMAQREPPRFTPQELGRARPYQKALVQLIGDTVAQVQAERMPGQEVQQALQAYRRAETLEELDRTCRVAVQELTSQLFQVERNSSEEAQLLVLLGVLEPPQADTFLESMEPEQAKKIRATLEQVLSPGMEQGSAWGWLGLLAVFALAVFTKITR